MKIFIKFHGILRDYIRQTDEEITTLALPDGASVKEILARLESLGLPQRLSIAVNSMLVDDLDLQLTDGDRVDVFQQSAGG